MSVGGKVGDTVGVAELKADLLVGMNVGKYVGDAVIDQYRATKPAPLAELSEVNLTSMFPDCAVIADGSALPENLPSSGAVVLQPSYTLSQSYSLSKSIFSTWRTMGAPPEAICHVQSAQDEYGPSPSEILPYFALSRTRPEQEDRLRVRDGGI